MAYDVSPTSRCNFHVYFKDSTGYEIGIKVAVAGREGLQFLDGNPQLITRTPTDRTAMKTSSGDTEFSDWRAPYYALKQEDFSGGRGLDDFSKDATRFFDAGGLNTRRPGFLHLNGQEQFSGLLRRGGSTGQVMSMNRPATPAVTYSEWAVKVNVSDNGTYDQIWFYTGVSASSISGVKLYDGADAVFQTLLQTCPASLPPSFVPGWHVINLTSPVTLTAASGVWVSIPLNPPTSWAVMPAINGYIKDGVNTLAGDGFACRVVKKLGDADRWARFFIYKSALYLVKQVASGTQLWINGYRGKLTAGTTTTATTTLNLTLNELAGKIFMVIGGAGYDEFQKWRVIASNTAGPNSIITMDDAYDFNLSTSEFVILGTDVWTEIASASHGLHVTIKDVLVSDKGIVYFAEGSTQPLRRMREYNNAGTWTREFADDVANGPEYLVQIGQDIYGAFSNAGVVKWAPAQDWGTNLSWKEKTIPCGDKYARFTGLDEYQDSAGYAAVAVMKEDIPGFISVSDKTFVPMKLEEMKVMRDERNGRAHLVHDTNLYLSFVNGFQRFYHPNLDDVGVDRDEGLPSNRQGDHRCVTGYPGKFYVGIDAGNSRYSGIFSSDGWHEEWRGARGQRPLAIVVQTIPGESNLDRLWIATGGTAGGDVNWIPLPSETRNPLEDDNMIYVPGGYIETATYFNELKTALKFLSLIKILFEEFNDTDFDYDIQYKLNDGAFTDLDKVAVPYVTRDETTVVYNLTKVVSSTPYFGLKGYAIHLRIKLFTTDKTKTPVLKALVMEGLARITNRYAYTIPFILEGTTLDPALDLLGTKDDVPAAETKLNKLIDWADGGPLYIRCKDVRLHNKMVLLLPFAEALTEFEDVPGKKVYLGQLTVQDA